MRIFTVELFSNESIYFQALYQKLEAKFTIISRFFPCLDILILSWLNVDNNRKINLVIVEM